MAQLLELHGPLRASDRKPIWIAKGYYEVEPAPATGTMSVIQARVAFMEDESGYPTPHRARTLRANFGTHEVRLQFFPGAGAATVESEPVGTGEYVHAVSRLTLASRDASQNDRLLIQSGEISVDAIKHPPGLGEFLGRMLPGFSEFSEIVLNTDGVAFVAKVGLPWQAEALLHARFQLRVPFGGAGASRPDLQVTLDRRDPAPNKADGMPGDAAATLSLFAREFDRLREAIARFEGKAPQWVELAISDDAIPGFSWEIAWAAGAAKSTFVFGAGSVKLILADAPSDLTSVRQRRIVTAHPVVRFEVNGGRLELRCSAGAADSSAKGRLSYAWSPALDGEKITLTKLTAGYNALTLARDVRATQGIVRPGETPDERVLWAAMPLRDGWLQWPVYNLVEEHYEARLPASTDEPLISGAAVFSNEPIDGSAPLDQHPWSITILDALGVNGTWTLGRRDGNWLTVSINFALREPELVLDGLLWLAKSPPTLRDALPDLEDFVGTIASISLSTNQSPFRFACPFRLNCEITITALAAADTAPIGQLVSLKMNVQNDPAAKLKESWFKGSTESTFLTPLIWRRYPSLPFIQSLPLTQSQDPPAHPCASRELAPFELPWSVPAAPSLPEIDPLIWAFESGASGARNWLTVPAKRAAAEWLATKRPVLPLASLSLPGLALQPGATAELPEESGLHLRLQYEFGLPYLDQVNAFAQLPKEDDDDYRGGLFSGKQNTAREDKQRRPLGRRDFKAWWEELSTKRFLARTESSDAIISRDAAVDPPSFVVRGLIEPLDWPIAPPKADLSTYPGRLELSNTDESGRLVLEGATALRGFDGYFGAAAGELVRRTEPKDGDFLITAGSMRAWQLAPHGMIRDQRGLSRGRTTQGEFLLDTPIEMDGIEWTVRNWLHAVPLQVGAENLWQILITGIAMKDGTHFKRRDVLSNQHEDVNDPAAHGRALNALSGYKWWLGPIERTSMRLFGLDVQPLALEAVTLTGTNLIVMILARLTVPLPLPVGVTQTPPRTVEQTQRGNAVLLTFSGSIGAALVLTEVKSAVTKGVWTLTPDEDGPLVTWDGVELAAGPSLKFSNVCVAFTHFGQSWNVKLEGLVFDGRELVSSTAEPSHGTPEIKVKKVELRLDLRTNPAPSLQHRIETDIGFHWGDAAGLAIETTATYEAWPAHGRTALGTIKVLPRSGAEGLEFLSLGGPAAAALGLQATFSLKNDVDASAWYLLPGMSLDGNAKEKIRGFLAMSFSAAQAEAVHGSPDLIPALRMTAGAAEVLLPCRWGGSMQDAPLGEAIASSAAFSSSSGDLYANCSLLGSTPKVGGAVAWERQTLLNGWLEVKNLVSWPKALAAYSGGAGTDAPLPDVKRWTLLFKTGENTPEDPAAAAKIYEEVKAFLEKHGGNVRIEGHADDSGPVIANYERSIRRAREVMRKLRPLIENLTPKPRISIAPYGEQRLKVNSSDDSARRQNRRVEIVLTLPGVTIPKRDGSADGWRHFRHTVRVLFNQHTLVAEGYSAGTGRTLFHLKGQSCQFLAATEHQIADVSLAGRGADLKVTVHQRWRWSVVQEVRFVRPAAFSAFLESTASVHHGLQPDSDGWNEGATIGAAFQSFHRAAWLKHLKLGQAKDQIALLGDGALYVEASVPLWLKIPDAMSEREPTMTTLQFLPDAVQRAELAAPEDIGFVHRGDVPWLSLGLPFVGRLQPAENDIAAAPKSIMMVDPVLWLSSNPGQSPPALCALACRSEDGSPIVVRLSEFDAPEANRWDRLSEGALEESWFRIQRPPPERLPEKKFAPLLAAAPQDSPGRLSRHAALRSIFRSQRTAVPPIEHVPPDGSSLIVGDIVWREASWFGIQMVSDLPKSSPQAFFLPGHLFSSVWGASRPEVREHVLSAAALVPVTPSQAHNSYNQPVGLAVSPYRCLGSTRISIQPEESAVVLTLAEVLATVTADDGGDAVFKPVADGMWPGDPGEEKVRLWAIELLSQVAPESTIAVVRLRQTTRSTADQTQVAVDYVYLLATPRILPPIDPPPLPLRSPPADIHFAEGQYGGSIVPKLMPFEIAPPQVAGIQPLYSEDLPSETRPAERQRLSALQLSVRNLDAASRAVVGRTIDPQDSDGAARLWWQALASRVAFESGLQWRKLLPKGFRSPARAAWLAASPRASGPGFKTLPLAPEPPAPDSNAPPSILQWQPVMPQGVDVLIAGSRAGAPVALRVLTETETARNGQLTPSASIPVQQRMPRPTSLPPNRPDAIEHAHQPWAALWFPEQNCLDKPECLTDIAVYDLASIRVHAEDGSVKAFPKRFGLRLRLQDAAPDQVALLAGSPLPNLPFTAEYYVEKDGKWTWKELAWISTDRNWANEDGLGAIGRGAGIGLATTGL